MKTISVVSWNIQGKINLTGHTSYRKIRRDLLRSTADIIALQECCDLDKMFQEKAIVKKYKIFVPTGHRKRVNNNPGYNHNVVLSRFPITHGSDVVFPIWNQKRYLENATRADIKIKDKILRLYNCHLTIFRVGTATRLKQLEHILEDSKKHDGPTIICGDMNTSIPEPGWKRMLIKSAHLEPKHDLLWRGRPIKTDERELFYNKIIKHGFQEALNLHLPTWSPIKSELWQMFNLKLDWFLVKDLEVLHARLGKYISDHKAIQTELKLN